MRQLIIFTLITIFIFFIGCAEKNGNISKTTFKENNNTETSLKKIGKPTPTFSVFKGDEISKDKGITSEEISEAKIAGKENLEEETSQKLSHEKIDFKLRDIHFDFNSYTIKPQDIPYLESLAEWLNNHPDRTIVIEGHCDERGSELYNLALGQRRADAVKNFLVNLGVDPKRIKTISYGEEMPIDPRHNEEAWAKNRRCHFVIE